MGVDIDVEVEGVTLLDEHQGWLLGHIEGSYIQTTILSVRIGLSIFQSSQLHGLKLHLLFT
jgi:hypothetical protein